MQACSTAGEKPQRRVSAQVAVEPPRHPPQPAAQHASGQQKRETQEQQNVGQLVSQFPGAQLRACVRLHHAIFRLTQPVQPALGQQVQGQRQPGQPVAQDSIVNIAAGGVVAGQGGRPLPGLAPAPRILVIAVAQRLMAGQP